MSFDTTKACTVQINGTRLANVEKIETHFERETTVTDGALGANLKSIRVKIVRKKHIGDAYDDGVIFCALKDFALTVLVPGFATSYDGCQWVDYKEYIGEGNTITEELTVAALSYKYASI